MRPRGAVLAGVALAALALQVIVPATLDLVVGLVIIGSSAAAGYVLGKAGN